MFQAASPFRSVHNDDIKLRELLEKLRVIKRFTPYVSGGRGSIRGDEASEILTGRRNQTTLIVSALAMVAAIIAAVPVSELLDVVQ